LQFTNSQEHTSPFNLSWEVDGSMLENNLRSTSDMTIPASKMPQAPSQATTTQVLPTPIPAQVIDGPVTRSRAKKLQQALLQNEALVDAQNHQKPRPFCGPGLKDPLTPVCNMNRC